VADLSAGSAAAADVVAEAAAEVRGGFTVAVRHSGAGVGLAAPVRALVNAGAAALVLPGDEVTARLLVVHDVPVERLRAVVEGVGATRAIFVTAPAAGHEDQVAVLTGVTDARVVVAGRGDDADPRWPPVVDVGRWVRPMLAGGGEQPVLAVRKPADREAWRRLRATLRRIAGPRSGLRVVVLRSPHDTGRVGRLRPNWSLLTADGGSLPAALAGVHFALDPVSTGGERWLLELLAAGVVVVTVTDDLPGDVAVRPARLEFAQVLRDLYADPAALRRHAETAREGMRARHNAAAHVATVASLLAPPDGEPTPASALSVSSRTARPRVLFVSTNGTGMGHLTRLMAMARRASPEVEPFFLSMSQAVGVVADEGFPFEYLPSRGDLGIGPRRWNALFSARLREVLLRVRPAAVVFDGTYPYEGLVERTCELPGTRVVWSRRAMWKPDMGIQQLESAGDFDLIVEPGELAAEADAGATVGRTDAVHVRPITLLDEDELPPRAEASAALGLDPVRPAVLVTLGAGNVNDLDSDLGILVAELMAVPGLQVCLTRPVIADAESPLAARVHGVSVYPISRYSRAFDFAFSACGYNSFHELICFGVPTVFVPNTFTPMDDQEKRARWAEQAGVGLYLPEVTRAGLKSVLATMTSATERERLRQRCREANPGNGARDAMAEIERLIGVGTTGGASA